MSRNSSFATTMSAACSRAFDPQAFGDEGQFTGRMRVRTYAAFGRVEFAATDRLMLEGALRYNADRRTFDHCAITTSEHFARFWNLIRAGAQPPTRIGDCWVLDPANALQPVDNVHHTLNEDSQSWRAGLNWTARPDLLLYANVSQGYKAGAVPVLAASTVAQLEPVPQESLLAYETGVKAGLFDRRAQLNVSAFYYDYEDKQLRGAVLDPTFGPLEALVSIPKSHVVGAEAQLVARPTDGLTHRHGCDLHEVADRSVHRFRRAGTVRQPIRHAVPLLPAVAVDHEPRL